MSWEEDPTVERPRELLRPRGHLYSDAEARRKRSKRLRNFLTVFGAMHWAERVGTRRPVSRRGRVAL
jgi:hypothetical protein